MGNLATDTEVEGSDGRYAGVISPDWEAWGPNGGFIAALGLRAAHAHGVHPRLASLSAHFVSAARFGRVDIKVTTLRRSPRAESMRVSVSQGTRTISESLVWAVADGLDGIVHDTARPPGVPHPDGLRSIRELAGPDASPPMPIWQNIDWKPLDWDDARHGVPDCPSGQPRWAGWYRYFPEPTFADVAADAARAVILLDLNPWSAATRVHPSGTGFIAPTLDLSVQFHQPRPDSEWLLADGSADVASGGLVAGRARVWSSDGTLIASAASSLLCKPLRPATAGDRLPPVLAGPRTGTPHGC